MVVVEPALAMVAEEADTGVLPLFPVPALISEDVGVVAPVGRMTHRTFSANVMVKETTVDVPVTVVAVGWTVKPDVNMSSWYSTLSLPWNNRRHRQ